jgi:CheY-like chemotaxis protein
MTGESVQSGSKPRTILHVEDDPVVLMAYHKRLQDEGFEVRAARDGVEAIQYLHNHVPDLVLLDLMLPKLNGADVLKFMRTQPSVRKVPIVVLSATSIIDIPDEYTIEHSYRRFLKGDCSFKNLLGAIKESLPDSDKGK